MRSRAVFYGGAGLVLGVSISLLAATAAMQAWLAFGVVAFAEIALACLMAYATRGVLWGKDPR